MTIQFDCPYCTSTLKVPDSSAGKQGDCPRCNTKLVIPNPFGVDGPPAPASVQQTETQSQPVALSEAPGQTQEQVPESTEADSQPAAMTSATSRYLRKRRKSNLGSIILFLFFIIPLLCVAGYFYWEYSLRLEGYLVAARLNSETAKLEHRIQATGMGVSDEIIQAVNQQLNKSSRRVKSDLIDMLFYGNEEGELYIRLEPGKNTEMVRVNLAADTALMDYLRKNGEQLDQPRFIEYQTNLKQFYTDWKNAIESGEDVLNLIHYRNTVGINSLIGGLGYHVEARVNSKIYPCVHDDFQGSLFFLVPKGTLQFEIVGRKMKNGRTPFPGKYIVQVTQEYPTVE